MPKSLVQSNLSKSVISTARSIGNGKSFPLQICRSYIDDSGTEISETKTLTLSGAEYMCIYFPTCGGKNEYSNVLRQLLAEEIDILTPTEYSHTLQIREENFKNICQNIINSLFEGEKEISDDYKKILLFALAFGA